MMQQLRAWEAYQSPTCAIEWPQSRGNVEKRRRKEKINAQVSEGAVESVDGQKEKQKQHLRGI